VGKDLLVAAVADPGIETRVVLAAAGGRRGERRPAARAVAGPDGGRGETESGRLGSWAE